MDRIRISPSVQSALAEGRGVVALESTIISHGLPWPDNLALARSLEARCRAAGAEAATVAVIEGVPCIGLSDDELERLAHGKGVAKASRRDLPLLMAKRLSGATTVSATMLLAARCGIRIFATGGIGGVHRGAAQTMDISADLTELARTPVAVVCAGAKSILDIGLTLEVLETQGVPIIGFGTDRFPAFYVRDSGHGVDLRMDDPADVATALHAQWGADALAQCAGVLVVNPIPVDEALHGAEVEAAIARAVARAQAQGIAGKALTPYLLAQLNAMTEGRSVRANLALVRHNVDVAAGIARAYAQGASGSS